MNTKVKNIPVRLLITVAILLILIAFIIGAQCSLGRYTSSFGGKLSFSPNAKGNFQFMYDEWIPNQENGAQILSFRVTNGGGESDSTQSHDGVRIRLYVPDTNVALPTLLLNQNGEKYTALISEIPEGTAVYRSYGAGQICCFYGADGEELIFDIPTSATESWNATLILVDEETDTDGFRLIVEPVNTESRGRDRL